MPQTCLLPTEILLPSPECDLSRWACIACDQHSSEPHYWEQMESWVGEAPSAYRLILPECYLNQTEARIPQIQQTMRDYLAAGKLRQVTEDGYLLTARTTQSGTRLGLMAKVDLEQYDYHPGSLSPIRASEETIESRIPPRVRIRRGAPLELPHVLLLMNDPENRLLEPLYRQREKLRPLYDFDLPLGGGHLSGYALFSEGEKAAVSEGLNQLRADHGLLFAVGDGNHSLATAKSCWEEIKAGLTKEEQATHPARFALVELVNIHSKALAFEPIHRVIFHADAKELLRDWENRVRAFGGEEAPGERAIRWIANGEEHSFCLPEKTLEVAFLQGFLDEWLKAHPQAEIDYIHGEASLRKLAAEKNAVAFLLPTPDRSGLFEGIAKGGSLPRKTFSMGEANEKRYYVECRRILP